MAKRVNVWPVKDNKWLPEGVSAVGPHMEIPQNIFDGMERFTGSYAPQPLGGGYYLEDKTNKIYKRIGGSDEKPAFEEIKVNDPENPVPKCYTIN